MKGDDCMRKVELNMTENNKYTIIKKLVDTGGNKAAAAMRIGCTQRHVNRMIKGYKEQGKEFFLHGNSGRIPAIAFTEEKRRVIIDLYNTKYDGANLTHYAELLLRNENIKVSPETIRKLLLAQYTLSPKAKRATKRRVHKELNDKLKATTSKKENKIISCAIVDIEMAHPRRPRCANFGEMIQMDASEHNWFGNEKAHLHAAIDDCTGGIVGAYFDRQETLKGYYNVANQILCKYGIPFMFLTDRRTVFEYKSKYSAQTGEDTFTQFSYACKQLGIQIKTTSVPQAKGRVERLYNTLQSRLPIELRLAGITTIEQANKFLENYIKKFNAQFSSIANYTNSVFEPQISTEEINLTLAVLAKRVVDSGHSIRFKNKFYKLVDSYDEHVLFKKGTKVLVIQAFNGELFGSVDETVYSLKVIPTHELYSRNFSFVSIQTPKHKIYIPPMSHPWKCSEFTNFIKTQKHVPEISFEDAANCEYPIFDNY